MPKQLFFLVILISSFYLNLFFISSSSDVYALENCRNPAVETIPNPLLSSTQNATFTIDILNNQETGVQGWKMEFQCGITMDQKDAVRVGDAKISTTLSNSGTVYRRCQFDPSNNPIKIKVKAVINNADVDYCFASYNVLNSDQQCELFINPQENITSTTDLSVSGKNLTPGGRFVVFFDEKTTKGISDYVETPKFDNYKIPTSFMSPGQHNISLRTRINNNTYPNVASAFSPPFCRIAFTIGTASQPGGLISQATTGGCQGPNCTQAAGISCNPNTGQAGDGGILTAIGCIPTDPQKLIEGLLKFTTAAGGGIALLLMVYGAFQMIISAGNPEAVKKGHEQFTSAIIGLLFIIFSVLLLKVIGVDILNIPRFQ